MLTEFLTQVIGKNDRSGSLISNNVSTISKLAAIFNISRQIRLSDLLFLKLIHKMEAGKRMCNVIFTVFI